jgi:hypothetical protein
MIADPQLATDLGYNVEAIKKTIQETVRNGSAFNNYANTDWEHMQAELRNNDAFFPALPQKMSWPAWFTCLSRSRWPYNPPDD